MYAITFNVDQNRLEKIYRQFSSLAYDDVRNFLRMKGFNLIHINADDKPIDQLSSAVHEVLTKELAKTYPWFSSCVSNIRTIKE